MKQNQGILEQAAKSLEIGEQLAEAMVIAVCADNSIYWLKNMVVRPPLVAVPLTFEHVIEYLERRRENGGPLPPDWAIKPPRKS